MKNKKIKPDMWKTATVILGVLLIISIFTNGFDFNKTSTLTAQEAADKAVDYINNYLLEPGTTASLTSVKDDGDLYNAQIDVAGNIFDSYITKDGRLLFPSSVDLGDSEIVAQTSGSVVEVSADDDPSIGPEDAPVTIIEFSDYECPFCAKVEPTIMQVLEAYGDDVRFVYRDFPLDSHRDAQKAAEAAECADDQGKFWEYHDLLFANQGNLGVSSLRQFASDLDLDVDAFNDCLDSDKYEDEVKKDFQDGQAAGVGGTPAFFINGQLVSGAQPFSVFKQVIDAELAKTNQ
jgi:protein-disulfide isomerase